MIKKNTKIINILGLHARPCAQLVSTATRFKSEIFFTKDGLRVNGKSMLGVMMLAAEKGSILEIEAEGPDEADAVEALIEIVNNGFGEEI